jgi:hypothetical protein
VPLNDSAESVEVGVHPSRQVDGALDTATSASGSNLSNTAIAVKATRTPVQTGGVGGAYER